MRRLLPFLLIAIAGCRHETFSGPLPLLTLRGADGHMPRVGALASGGETRAALLESARYRVPLPPRPLLTFGVALSYTGQGEAPGWYHLEVRADGRVIDERKLNPRTARGFRDVSLPLEGLGSATTLDFSLRLADRDGRTIAAPPELLLGVAEPVVHDLDGYGAVKGIVLISIDTERRDHISAYGYDKPTTPRFDALARQGVLCEDAVSTSSWTLPAHLSMLTSQDPSVHGAVDMRHSFNHRVPTLPAILHGAGFATQAVTSHLYVSEVYGVDDGFDHLDFHQDRKATDVADRAVDLLDRLGDRPFFLFLHLYDPHWHYDPPADHLHLFETSYSGQVTGNWKDFSRRDTAKLNDADKRHLQALYDGELHYADAEVGRVLDHLKARGLERGTLVVMTSDHGEEFLDHGSWEHQKTLYEEVVRVPMAFRGPGIAPRRELAQTSVLDVAPTILAWAGISAPAPLAGRSLLASPGEREVYGETDHTVDRTRKLFLRAGAGRWKTILSLAPDGTKVVREEWYDLALDKAEQRNAPPPQAAADAIRARALERWHSGRGRGGEAPTVHLTPEQLERLNALGYLGP